VTARAAVALALAIAAMLAALVAKVIAWNVLAGTLLACVLVGVLVLYAAYRLIATGKGAHVAPHGWAEAGERLALPCEATIPRAPTEHAPPWDGEKVIEPAAIMAAPVPDPDAYWIVAWTVSHGGRVRLDHVAGLPAPVAALLGHDSTDDAVAAMSAGWHSVESIFNGHHAREVRALTDGAS
jgi:hypothetical protein